MSGGDDINNTTSMSIGNPSSFVFKNFKIEDDSGKGWVTAKNDLYLTGNWTLPKANPNPQILNDTYQRFRPETSGVIFKPLENSEIQISGDTLWYKLNYESNGAKGLTLSFSPYPTSHRVINDITIKGLGDNSPITVTRIGGDPLNPPPYPPNQPGEPTWNNINKSPFSDDFFWVLDIDTAKTASAAMDYLSVWYSYVTPSTIDANSHVLAPWGYGPAWDPVSNKPHWVHGWKSAGAFMYGFTEDALGDDGNPGANGRIDRIRLESTVVTNGDFSDFFLNVDGYDLVNIPGAVNGCILGPGRDIYIYIKERAMSDTGSTPSVSLAKQNNSLRMNVEPYALIDIPENKKTGKYDLEPIDTAPPRIAYSLTLPNEPSVYMRFSELVKPSSLPNSGNFDIEGATQIAGQPTTINPEKKSDEQGNIIDYAAEYLIPLTNGFDANDIVNGLTYNEDIFESVMDVPPDPYKWPDPIPGSMTYPKDYDYNGYATFDTGANIFPDDLSQTNIWQPNKFRKSGDGVWNSEPTPHRVSDLLVMMNPSSANDKNLSLWPLYARDKAGLQDVKPGIARVYDGSETIRNTDIIVENISASGLSMDAPRILFDANIPDQYKASSPEFTSNIGLWLTTTQAKSGIRPPYLNMVPKEVPYSQLKNVTSTKNNDRYFITLPEKDLPDSSLVEFVYSIPNPAKSPDMGPLYGVRVNAGQGASILSGWYNKLDTFKINVRGIVYQRSGATILSNVVNPTKGEKAVLNYILSSGGQVTIQVFTLDGVLVQTLFRGSRPAGEYVISWDGKNNGGNIVARGMYFIRIVAPDIDEIRKIMIVK
jgi:hypothetical protein